MTDHGEQSAQPRSRKRRGWLIALAVVAGLVVAFAAWSAWEVHAVNSALAALRAEGMPTSMADLAPKPVPPERNAGLIYQRLFFEEPGPLRPNSPARDFVNYAALRSWEAADKRQGFLARPDVQRELALLQQAAALPDCVLPGVDWARYWQAKTPVPDYGGGFLETSYLLGTQVQHLGEEGRLREVFDWLGVAWRVSDQCRATPSWFVTFPATYITYSACQGAWRGCRNADVPGELSAPTVDRLLKEDGHAAMRKNLIDDRAYALDVLRQDSGPFARVKPPVWDEVYGSPAGVGFRAWDEVGMLHAFAVRISLADRPWHEAAPRLAELKSYLDRRVFDRDLMLLSGDAMQSRRDHEAAQLQAFGLFLAAKAYRHDRGAYPESLDQLAQYLHRTLPVSPFNGQAYGYARQGQGFVVTVPGDPDEVRRTHSLIWKCEK